MCQGQQGPSFRLSNCGEWPDVNSSGRKKKELGKADLQTCCAAGLWGVISLISAAWQRMERGAGQAEGEKDIPKEYGSSKRIGER